MPRISVIVNVYNGERFLAESLQSALSQSFSDFELIVWDDASTDGSAAVVAQFTDSRIRYFAVPERVSLGQARSQAMALACGQWLAFLDQDDIWLPDKLAVQMQVADSSGHGLGLIYGRTVAFDRYGRQWDASHRHEFRSLPEGKIFFDLFLDSCFISMSSVLLLRDAVLKLLPIPAEIIVSPDYYLYLGVAFCYKAGAVQEPVCRYRIHEQNMTWTVLGQQQEEALWLVSRYADRLNPALVRERRRRHSSVAALVQMRRKGGIAEGLVRLCREGSLPFVLSRPAAWVTRAIRRRLSLPYWRRTVQP